MYSFNLTARNQVLWKVFPPNMWIPAWVWRGWCVYLQNKQSNYDTDIFSGTLAAIAKITGGRYTGSDTEKKDIAFRVIADHIRAIGFTICRRSAAFEYGAGYVIRRILRRAVRYYYSYLGPKRTFCCFSWSLCLHRVSEVFPGLKNSRLLLKGSSGKKKKLFCEPLIKGSKYSMNISKTGTHRNQNPNLACAKTHFRGFCI